MIEIVRIDDISRIKHLGYQTYAPHYPYLWNDGGMEWYMHRCFNEQQLATDLADSALTYYAIRFNEQDAGLLKLVKAKHLMALPWRKPCILKKSIF